MTIEVDTSADVLPESEDGISSTNMNDAAVEGLSVFPYPSR